mmetsp:Transcript_24259/g.48256  ORF Transcript_24259/g.48256 Transcript_24259/m.48256 type:complete len:84 (-) Transcript_24259:38-289(-)
MTHMFTKCATSTGLDPDVLQTCAEGDEGLQLQLAAGATTAALDPPHTYVPWVLVNGELSPSDGENLLQEVCDAYQGTKPAGCP